MTVVRQQVRVRFADDTIRYYDRLAMKSGGTYIGIEVRTGDVPLSASQPAFDGQVKNGATATGTLNGQEVCVTEVELVKAK